MKTHSLGAIGAEVSCYLEVGAVLQYITIAMVGYVGLWILGIICFLVYFMIFNVQLDLKHTVNMIQRIPSVLAISTVTACSFMSFFVTAWIVFHHFTTSEPTISRFKIGIFSLATTIILDLLITVAGEKIDIRKFPVNWMYLFAWLVIVPSVVLAGFSF